MKEVQKVVLDEYLAGFIRFMAVLVIGMLVGICIGWQSAKNNLPQPAPTAPTPTDEAKPPTPREAAFPPRNPLEDIANRIERGITRERLERAVAELDDGRLTPVIVRKEHVTFANGASSAMEYWSWNLRMKKAEKETWDIMLTLDLVNDKVVGIHYVAEYDTVVTTIHK
ncbi:MAG: hypothetical protein HYZ07_02040 [Candidatus Harrisonbacteria bacterium]|nr:hypothetical protein [Candidatus Harrisonbacteria bacterium]MBI2406508.1 hypothetical protein [Candidatus Harrisonbacteria bacterium]MBI2604432.1 hypothetical protein [Candidatus Harrisonbacteria bacterium]MBI3114718.1 hypothetical protein [Candidatus Harrisonbacteria bacterium]